MVRYSYHERRVNACAVLIPGEPQDEREHVLELGDYPRAACAGRPGISRSGGGGAGFGMSRMSWLGTSVTSSSSVHLPSFVIC